MPSPRVPHTLIKSSTLHRKANMAALPFFRRWKASDSTLFQMTLVAILMVTVLGDCGLPPILPFASPINQLYETSFETGTILKYTCRPGFKRINSSFLMCGINGIWTYSVFCDKKQCRNPGALLNGNVEIITDLLLGSIIRFSCFKGYHLIGPTSSQCEIQGKGVEWSTFLPECIIVKCEPPPAISNGKHNGGDQDFYTYGSSLTYSCDPNFSLIGNASIFCTVVNKTIGVWSSSPPTCEKIICYPPQIPNGIFVSGFGPYYIYKDSIVIRCQKDHRLKGSSLILCDANSQWYPSIPSCEPNGCNNLPDIPFASWEKNGLALQNPETFKIGTVLKYKCKPGYQPSGVQTVTCQKNLTWTLPKGCERVCCPTPNLEKMRILSERKEVSGVCTYSYGDYIIYICDEGYYPMSIDGRSSCQADGKWNPIPFCRPGVCPKPEIKHGRPSVEKKLYLEMERLAFECDSGYRMVGSNNIICLQNRTWYPKIPRCEKEFLEGCEQVHAGKKLMSCLTSHDDVKRALEVYKLSLEIKRLEQEIQTHQNFSEDEDKNEPFLPLN